jgi:hypothetical protein
MQLDIWEGYRNVERLGRPTRLKEPQRKLLWTIFEGVRSGLRERGAITRSGLFNVLAQHYVTGAPAPYDFCVVDEAQDISIAQLRFLAAVGGNRPNALFFAGDLGQRIFQQPFSWKAAGVGVRARRWVRRRRIGDAAGALIAERAVGRADAPGDTLGTAVIHPHCDCLRLARVEGYGRWSQGNRRFRRASAA